MHDFLERRAQGLGEYARMVTGRIRHRGQPEGPGPIDLESGPRLLGVSMGRNVEFFSTDPLTDLKSALEVIYRGPALPQLQAEIDQMDPTGEDIRRSTIDWDYLPDDILVKLNTTLRVLPFDGKRKRISILAVGAEDTDLRDRLAQALKREPIAAPLSLRLGFKFPGRIVSFLKGRDIAVLDVFRTEVYRNIAREAFGRFQKGSSNEQLKSWLREQIYGEILHPQGEPRILDRGWLNGVMQYIGEQIPEAFSGRVSLDTYYKKNPQMTVHFSFGSDYEWDKETDGIQLVGEKYRWGGEESNRLAVHVVPTILSDDPAYQQEIVTEAKRVTGIPDLPVQKSHFRVESPILDAL